ncbi:competence protein ComGE [Anoxybacillus calidus]|jgi:competence protein ComGE|uniref:Competence protein ComGE n=1 Tax=[Anoxybacillus] calidus TaxID=575178 RepID=A0A7V9YWS5_9BACL|nr:competence type IV pilus minor pilin ComGE [Anoxybacillus calidus]MBA2869911.1 competence protein ComGE [Anoxybacillus calidus]
MCKNCNGFTLIEMLVSLGIWLLVATILLPSFIQISLERKNEELKSIAQQILNEELRMYDLTTLHDKTIRRNDVLYTIRWEFTENGTMKACIRWQDYTKRAVERCGYTKK